MPRLAASSLASALVLASAPGWSASADGFSYWGVGLQAQEFGVDLDLSAMASDEAANPTVDYAYGTRFFAGYQFNNGFALEASAFGGVTPIEQVNGDLRLGRRKEFSVDTKAAYTFALSEAAFARAHIGMRFYTRQSFIATTPAEPNGGWSLEQAQLSTSDMTAGLGAGFAWGARRAVLVEYEALQAREQALHSLSLSLMFRI